MNVPARRFTLVTRRVMTFRRAPMIEDEQGLHVPRAAHEVERVVTSANVLRYGVLTKCNFHRLLRITPQPDIWGLFSDDEDMELTC
jgi:hypothetical protein